MAGIHAEDLAPDASSEENGGTAVPGTRDKAVPDRCLSSAFLRGLGFVVPYPGMWG